ncbi:MAG: DUF3971 domain-containing protein [Cohaesibacter sp.]|nr:DUF3971 domain-containing protein [Cohaesibacter sp.]
MDSSQESGSNPSNVGAPSFGSTGDPSASHVGQGPHGSLGDGGSGGQMPPLSPPPISQKVAAKKKSWLRLIMQVMLGLLLAMVVIVALAAARIAISPLSIATLVGDLEDIVSGALPAGQIFELEDAQISFAEEGGLALRITNVELREGADILFAAPRVDLEIDFLSLLKQKMRPKQIYVPSMKARVVRDQLGRFIFAGQDPGGVSQQFGPPVRSQAVYYNPDEPEFLSIIYGLRRALKPLAEKDLSKRPPRILIRNTEIQFTDQLANKSRTLENVAFSYNPKGDESNDWRIDFAVDGQKGRIAFAMAEYPLEQAQDGMQGNSLELRFADVSLADIWPKFAEKARRFKFSSPFYGAVRLDFDLKESLADMKIALDVGAGRLDFGDDDTALLDEASLRLDWEPEARVLALEFGRVLLGETGGEFKGVAVWPENRQGEVRLALEGLNIKLDARDNPAPAKVLNQILLQARVGRENGIMTIDRFAAIAPEGRVEAAGSVAMVEDVLTAGLAFDISPMPYDLVTQMWPVNIAGGARRWVIKNVIGGRTTGGSIEVSLTDKMFERTPDDRLELPDDAVSGAFGLESVKLAPFGDLAPVQDIDGTGIITGRTFLASLTRGKFVSKNGYSLPITSGRFEIPDHAQKPATGILLLEAKGSVAALGDVVDHDPLAVLKKEKLVAKQLKGNAVAKVQLSFPFKKDLKKKDVTYSAKVDLSKFSSAKKVRGRKIDKANLTIKTDGNKIDISGKGRIDGLVANIDVATSTDQSVALKSNVKLILSQGDRERLGLRLGSWLQGPVTVSLKQDGKQKNHYFVDVDLTRSVLAIPEIGWTKKAGVKGRARFETVSKGSRFIVSKLEISGQGFSASGEAVGHEKAGLESLTIRSLSLSRGDRLSISAKLKSTNNYDIKVRGKLLDIRSKLLGNALLPKKAEKKATTTYKLDAKIDQVIGMGGNVLTNVSAVHEVVKGKDKAVMLRAKINGRIDLSIDTNRGTKPVLHIATADAGSLLRFLGYYGKLQGGRLSVSLQLQKGWEQLTGSVFLKKFYIKGNQRKNANNQGGANNTQFDKLTLNFSSSGGAYTISKGAVKGPALGATIYGTMNMATKQLALTGTYIPVYAVNNLFSRLPVIGRALGNRKNEGLLGVTYKIKGTMQKPKVIVNPASVLAPGALRKLFEFKRN